MESFHQFQSHIPLFYEQRINKKMIKNLLYQINTYFLIAYRHHSIQNQMIDRRASIILFTLYFILTTLNGLSHPSRNIEFGCKVLNLHHIHTINRVEAWIQQPFEIVYQRRYDQAPVTIMGMIGTLETDMVEQVQTAKLMKGISTQKETEIKIRATEGIKIVKISYFVIANHQALKMGISSIYSGSFQVSSFSRETFQVTSISREEEMIHISQMVVIDNKENKIKRVREYTQPLPIFLDVDNMQSTVILNQLNIIHNKELSLSIQIQKNENKLTIMYHCGEERAMSEGFVSYVIILYDSALLERKVMFFTNSIGLQDSLRKQYREYDQPFFLGISCVKTIGQSTAFYMQNTDKSYEMISSGLLQIGSASMLFLQMNSTVQEQQPISLLSQIQEEQLRSRRLITCSAPYYSTIYSNAWPTWLDPVKKNIETCQMCPTGCYSCHYCSSCLRYVNCTSCRPGFTYTKIGFWSWPNMYVCRCTSGFPNATSNTCMGCADVIPSCTSCVSKQSGHFSATCGTCTPGYFTVPNDGSWGGFIQCGKCIPGCSGCSSFTSCNTCGTGLVNINGICSCSSSTSYYSTVTKTCTTCPLAITGCTTCTAVGAATTCVTCRSGFFLTNGTCSACQSNCQTCTATACSSCISTFIPSGNSCICNQTAENFLNNSTNKCQACTIFITGCMDCNLTGGIMSCEDCITGSYYNGTSCNICPTYCFDCDNTSACTSCINNLEVIGIGCSCPSDSYLNVLTSTCIVCDQLFPSCSSCVTNTSTLSLECSDCAVGYYLNTLLACEACPKQCADCQNSTACTTCIIGYEFNNITHDCDCIACTNCTAQGLVNCSSCVYNSTNSSYQCFSCIGGFYLQGISCIICPPGCASCTTATYCNTCSLPFIAGTTPGQCVCNSLTLFYYNPTGTTCSSCGDIITNCSSCSSLNYVTTCLKCIDGYYTDGISCFSCSSICPLCSSSTVCLSCINTYILVNGQCICNNATQQFRSNNTGYCEPCKIIASVQCLNCELQPAALATSGVKCTICADGYYPNPTTFICSECPSTCTTCTSTACLQCQPTFTLINDTCICDEAVNFYPSGEICRPCFAIIDYCLNCSNAMGQTNCIQCGPGTFSIGTQCKLCSINCLNCTSQSTCITCNEGYTLNLNATCQCITTCSNYSSADPSCISCNMTNSTLQCLACKTGTFLVQSSICSPCPSTCTSCIDAVNCLLCQASFTLISGQCKCNEYFGQIVYNSLCQTCSEMIEGCSTCSLISGSPSCSACIIGWTLTSGTCTYCDVGCELCTIVAGLVNCITCNEAYTPSGSGCNPIGTCGLTYYYVVGNNSCYSCGANCDSCFDANGCILCQDTYKNIDGSCVCSEGLGYFHDDLLDTCVQCLSTLNGSATYLQDCKRCHQKEGNFESGIECLECIDGYYISAEGTCVKCSSGCLKCTSPTTCYSCFTPFWTMINGVCDCNIDLSYFTDNMGDCPKCSISNCSLCISLTQCVLCDFGYFINSNETCQLAVCSNNATQGIQTCDDGNIIDGDGCSSTCQVQTFYFCNNDVTPSICYYDNRFNIEISQIINDCNKVTFKFRIYPYYGYYDSAKFDYFLYKNDLLYSTLQSYSREGDTISYTYKYTNSLQGMMALFQFNPTSLDIAQTSTYPIAKSSFEIDATNNQQVIHYSQDKCKQKQSLQKFTDAIQYASYGIMLASAFPAKIVGLQLSGVLQLSFFAIGSMDNVNILLSPLKKFKSINGFLMPIQQSSKRLLQASTEAPERIQSIEYASNFIRNCNIMLLLVVLLLLVSIFLIIASYVFKNCAPTLFSVSQKLLKQVMLTLILFNCFNFAYSAGIHFRYASRDDDLYILGTISAAIALIFPIVMAIALLACSQDGFGQFKDKMKKGCVEKGYFVVTIAYRACLGLYMSSSNEQKLSTLIILAISIMFLLYNLVNLPFAKAYHNYRANICHLTQFICLFVAMYYRSIKGTSSPVQTAEITSPVFFQYVCIGLSLVVSLIVLIYEICLWIKQCRKNKSSSSTRIQNTSEDLPNNNNNSSMMKGNEKENLQQIDFDIYDM